MNEYELEIDFDPAESNARSPWEEGGCIIPFTPHPRAGVLQLPESDARNVASAIFRLRILESKVATQDNQIAKLWRIVDEMRRPELIAPEKSDYEMWVETADAQKYAGQHVAFVPGRGVVASADTLDALGKMFPRDKRPKGTVIDFIPCASF